MCKCCLATTFKHKMMKDAKKISSHSSWNANLFPKIILKLWAFVIYLAKHKTPRNVNVLRFDAQFCITKKHATYLLTQSILISLYEQFCYFNFSFKNA